MMYDDIKIMMLLYHKIYDECCDEYTVYDKILNSMLYMSQNKLEVLQYYCDRL